HVIGAHWRPTVANGVIPRTGCRPSTVTTPDQHLAAGPDGRVDTQLWKRRTGPKEARRTDGGPAIGRRVILRPILQCVPGRPSDTAPDEQSAAGPDSTGVEAAAQKVCWRQRA